MSLVRRALNSSIGKKQLVAITGLGLCGFLVAHLAGNFLIFAGPEAFDGYAKSLEDNPLLIPMEAGLLAIFLVHIALALKSFLENRKARPQSYVMKESAGRENVMNKTMPISGVIILAFVVFHLIEFKFGDRNVTLADGRAVDSLYWLVVTYFQSSILYVVWYVFAVCVLGAHVGHGLQSACQTLGINHPKYTPAIKWASVGFGFVVAVGYGILPIYCLFQE